MAADEYICIPDHSDDDESSRAVDLTEWMTNLPNTLHDVPLNQLAIPGSHDSGAYWLNTDLPIAPDEPRLISFLGRCAKGVVRRWSLTQNLNITNQLQNGIRYFDMRTVYKE